MPFCFTDIKPMKKNAAPKSFEEAVKRLEVLTQAMQSSDMPLEDALAAYQEGNGLVQYCQNKLAEVEQKLQVLDAGEVKELNLDPSE
ncbi:exodeoxyribonuclease VII small subunit [Neisseria animalis]|nr:exodeoxyribonuclease VII small subunit [Neisseria animalis]